MWHRKGLCSFFGSSVFVKKAVMISILICSNSRQKIARILQS